MQRTWIAFGSLMGLAAVAMAALAAHALPDRLDPRAMGMVHNALQMQGWHALALLACGFWAERGRRFANLAGAAFAAGIVVFCGAVYALALAGVMLPMVAPVGGALLMLGWVLLGLSALRA